jgi:hypothetical protein
MTTLLIALSEIAAGGTLFYIDAGEPYVQAMDTRSLERTNFASVAGLGLPVAGLAFDGAETFWMHWKQGVPEDLIWLYPPYIFTYEWYQYFGTRTVPYDGTNSIVYDPSVDKIVVFAWAPPQGIFDLYGVRISDSPDYPFGATWEPNLGGFLVVDFYGALYSIVNYGQPQVVGNIPVDAAEYTFGLSYDRDTSLIWVVTDIRGIFGLDPLTYEQVAWLPPGPRSFFGATSQNYDPVPAFEPELLVTGSCPGEVFVTAVDHTPGGQVKIFSGTRPGTLVSPPGAPCAGASLGIRNPVLRGTLTANSLGLASTKFQAPASMCGSWRFQAVDVSTCMPSSVRGLP